MKKNVSVFLLALLIISCSNTSEEKTTMLKDTTVSKPAEEKYVVTTVEKIIVYESSTKPKDIDKIEHATMKDSHEVDASIVTTAKTNYTPSKNLNLPKKPPVIEKDNMIDKTDETIKEDLEKAVKVVEEDLAKPNETVIEPIEPVQPMKEDTPEEKKSPMGLITGLVALIIAGFASFKAFSKKKIDETDTEK